MLSYLLTRTHCFDKALEAYKKENKEEDIIRIQFNFLYDFYVFSTYEIFWGLSFYEQMTFFYGTFISQIMISLPLA